MMGLDVAPVDVGPPVVGEAVVGGSETSSSPEAGGLGAPVVVAVGAAVVRRGRKWAMPMPWATQSSQSSWGSGSPPRPSSSAPRRRRRRRGCARRPRRHC